MGLGAQLIAWPIELVDALVDRGFYVIRYDNRDVGLSTKLDGDAAARDFMAQFMAAMQGQPVQAPYLLTDMAADGIGLLDHLGIDVGPHRRRVDGRDDRADDGDRAPDAGSARSRRSCPPPATPTSASPPPRRCRRCSARSPPPATRPIDRVGGDEPRSSAAPSTSTRRSARKRAEEAYDRCFNPAGIARQLLGIVASGSRAEGLAQLDVPTLVIHGAVDPLVTLSGGERTAELIPGAELLVLEEMGHDLPLPLAAADRRRHHHARRPLERLTRPDHQEGHSCLDLSPA